MSDLPKTYTVSGPWVVAGVHPGDEVTETALLAEGANIGQLIEAGHLVEAAPAPTVAKKIKAD